MRRSAFFLVVVVTLSGLLAGCSKSRVNTGELRSTFQSAEPDLKSQADNALAAIRAGNNREALTILQALSRRAKLTADQQLAIKNMILQIQKQMAEPPKPPAPPKK